VPFYKILPLLSNFTAAAKTALSEFLYKSNKCVIGVKTPVHKFRLSRQTQSQEVDKEYIVGLFKLLI